MSDFKPKCLLSGSNEEDKELTELTKALSDSFVSSVSSLQRSFRVRNSNVWDNVEIDQIIQVGKPVRIWSQVLNTFVLWCRDNRVKELCERKSHEVTIWTLAEIAELLRQGCGDKELKVIYEAKMLFPGSTVVKI